MKTVEVHCDRCGKRIISLRGSGKVTLVVNTVSYEVEMKPAEFDLCQECTQEARDFLRR